MYAFLIITAYLIINIFIFLNFRIFINSLFKDKRTPAAVKIPAYAFFLVCSLCMVAQAYLPTDILFYRQIKDVSSYWIAVMIYGGITSFFADVIFLLLHANILKRTDRRHKFAKGVGVFICALTLIMIITGHINATNIRINSFDITAQSQDAEIDRIKIAMVGDLHLGYNADLSLMEQMVEKINSENPDLIIMVGDIFDNNFDAIENTDEVEKCLSNLSAVYGVYSIWGNHDIDEQLFCGFDIVGNTEIDDSAYLEFLDNSGITLLADESVLIADSVYLVGREDESRAKKRGAPRADIDNLLDALDKEKAIIVLDHQPIDYEAVSKAGGDIELSGHTHNGQVFPGNIVLAFMWDNIYGYKTFGNLKTLVTCGVGSWGPYIRTGLNTASEIMIINLSLT